jgi:glycosyltransferase involved in cell wall biosynthesis
MVIIDADLQDPPELMPQMLDKWRNGADVVLMKRVKRHGETFLKKFTARMFYKFMSRVCDIRILENVGDFRLMSRKVVDAIKNCPESTRFMKGLFAWVGFRTETIEYERDARTSGNTAFSYRKLWNFAWDGVVSFSAAPLKIPTYIGLFLLAFCLAYSAANFAIMEHAAEHAVVISCMAFAAGLQLLVLGIMGKYLSRIAIECRRRPLYIIGNLYDKDGKNEKRSQS